MSTLRSNSKPPEMRYCGLHNLKYGAQHGCPDCRTNAASSTSAMDAQQAYSSPALTAVDPAPSYDTQSDPPQSDSPPPIESGGGEGGGGGASDSF